MCGRFTQMLSWDDLYRISNLVVPSTPIPVRYNLAPTQRAAVILNNDKGDLLGDFFRWGLIPSWCKDIKKLAPLINAKAETLSEKPSFRSAFKSRRCLVPVNGFFEWKPSPESKIKKPFYITAADNTPLFFAGLWETWQKSPDELIRSFTIITTSANNLMSTIHDRMPVILPLPTMGEWMNPHASADSLNQLLKPLPDDLLKMHEVSTIVNSVKNDVQECVARV